MPFGSYFVPLRRELSANLSRVLIIQKNYKKMKIKNKKENERVKEIISFLTGKHQEGEPLFTGLASSPVKFNQQGNRQSLFYIDQSSKITINSDNGKINYHYGDELSQKSVTALPEHLVIISLFEKAIASHQNLPKKTISEKTLAEA